MYINLKKGFVHVDRSVQKQIEAAVHQSHQPREATLTEGDFTLPVSTVMQTITAVPRTITAVPQATTPVPQAITAVSQAITVTAVPRTITVVPQAITAVPQAITAVPQATTAVPQATTAVPQAITAVTRTVTPIITPIVTKTVTPILLTSRVPTEPNRERARYEQIGQAIATSSIKRAASTQEPEIHVDGLDEEEFERQRRALLIKKMRLENEILSKQLEKATLEVEITKADLKARHGF